MYRNRKILLFGMMFLAMIMSAFFAVKSLSSESKTQKKNPFVVSAIVSAQIDGSESGYYLSVNDGYIAVFYNSEPIYTSKIDSSTLRTADREMLEDGIKAESYEEVLRLLEDFCS